MKIMRYVAVICALLVMLFSGYWLSSLHMEDVMLEQNRALTLNSAITNITTFSRVVELHDDGMDTDLSDFLFNSMCVELATINGIATRGELIEFERTYLVKNKGLKGLLRAMKLSGEASYSMKGIMGICMGPNLGGSP